MEIILSTLVLTGISYILYLQIKSKRREEQGSGILMRQSPIFSMLGSACIIADIVIVIVLLTCESEGIIAAYMAFFTFFIPGIIFLISNRKTVRILENKIIYSPIIGKKKEIMIDDFSYIIRKSQYATFYAYGDKRICQLNFLMDNYLELIMHLEDNGVECKDVF